MKVKPGSSPSLSPAQRTARNSSPVGSLAQNAQAQPGASAGARPANSAKSPSSSRARANPEVTAASAPWRAIVSLARSAEVVRKTTSHIVIRTKKRSITIASGAACPAASNGHNSNTPAARMRGSRKRAASRAAPKKSNTCAYDTYADESAPSAITTPRSTAPSSSWRPGTGRCVRVNSTQIKR